MIYMRKYKHLCRCRYITQTSFHNFGYSLRMIMKSDRDFYIRDTLQISADLLGKLLVVPSRSESEPRAIATGLLLQKNPVATVPSSDIASSFLFFLFCDRFFRNRKKI